MIKPGSRVLLIKYGTLGSHDCIEEHRKVLNEKHYCWFGKIGTPPSKKKIEELFPEGIGCLILYCQGKGYICSFDLFQYEKPLEGYPTYYDTSSFIRNNMPRVFLRLLSIDDMEREELMKLETLSSGSSLAETAHRSMASFFYGYLPDPEKPIIRTAKKKVERKKEASNPAKTLPENDCKYRVGGTCKLRSCVNYQYECDSPKYCTKQKR